MSYVVTGGIPAPPGSVVSIGGGLRRDFCSLLWNSTEHRLHVVFDEAVQLMLDQSFFKKTFAAYKGRPGSAQKIVDEKNRRREI